MQQQFHAHWLVAVIAIAVTAPMLSYADDAPLHKQIDQQIEAGFAKWNASPAEQCTDADFIRRVYLDLTGTIPSADAARTFMANKDANKRPALIDHLLASDKFAQHMAVVFDVTLMERRPDKYVTTAEWRNWLADSFAENKPLNVLAAEILGADGVNEQQRPAARFYLDRAVDKDVLVKDIGRLFLGMNLQCAQCHDHPDIDDYLHQHYHGLSVFIAGSKTFRQSDGKFVLQEVVMREVEFASVFDPEETKKTGPRLLDALMDVPEFPAGEEYVEKPSRTVRSVPKFSLRELLSQRLPSDETPEFARNMANRLWAMMMGRGLVHPLDMHHSGNPPSHPELLDLLMKHLMETGYDVQGFLREVALSEAYQRSSLVPDGVDPEALPVESYAVANMKGLSPEQLFESLLVATRAQAILERQIDDALADNAAESPDQEQPDEAAIRAARREKRTEQVAKFVAVFGSVPGQPQNEFSASLPQALFLANSETVAEWVPPRLGNLAERMTALVEAEPAANELYLAVLSRLPSTEELDLVKKELDSIEPDQRRAKMAALVWSLVASAEFRLNH